MLMMFYIDDGNICCPFDIMIRILKILMEHGPQYGFKIKKTKGAYLLGKCASLEEAERRKRKLVEDIGISEDVIKMHPDNGGDALQYGGVVLGSFVGSDEYCLSKLGAMAEEFQDVAEKIQTVHSEHVKFLLLKLCFCQKFVYFQRTTPPSLISRSGIETIFTDLKFDVLASILGCGSEELDERVQTLAQFRTSDGGLGLSNVRDVTLAAYVASYTECYFSIRNKVNMNVRNNLRSFREFQTALDQINNVRSEAQPNQDAWTLQSLQDKVQELQDKETLQEHLIEPFHIKNKKNFKESLRDPRQLAWFTSVSSKDAGIWLEIAPKTDMHRMSNPQFTVALRLRLFMPQKFIQEGTKCNCSAIANSTKYVDREGIHFCTGCGFGYTRSRTHDLVRDQLCKTLRYCGVNIRVEERNAFRGSDPNNGTRPDLTAFNLAGTNQSHALDVRLTSPVPANGAVITLNTARKELTAADKAAQAKNKKYAKSASDNNLGFKPIIFEITGAMHREARTLLKTNLMEAAKKKGIVFGVLWKYWVSALMMTMHRSLANGIMTRADSVNGRFEVTHETSKATISTFEYINTR